MHNLSHVNPSGAAPVPAAFPLHTVGGDCDHRRLRRAKQTKNARVARALLMVLLAGVAGATAPPVGQGPSFVCEQAAAGIEALICNDERLSALDRELTSVWAAAFAKATNEHSRMLRAEQRGWIKGRDDCWKSDDQRNRVERGYLVRIAETAGALCARAGQRTGHLGCEGNPANAVVATYFATEPAHVDRRTRR